MLGTNTSFSETMDQSEFLEKYRPSPTKTGKPAKKRSAYKFFKLTQGNNIKEQFPNLKGKAYTQKIAEIYNSLPCEERLIYEDMSRADKQRMTQEYAELGMDPESVIFDSNDEGNLSKKGRRRRWSKAEGAPKKALTPYILFVREERARLLEEVKERNLDYKPTDMLKELSRRWNEATPNVKSHYEQLSNEDKERYALEKAAWIASREEQGIFEHPTIKRNMISDDENEASRIFKVRVKGEDLFDKITVRRLTWKGLVKKIQDKKNIYKNVETITHLPDIRIRDSEDVSTLPEYAELEIQFVED